MAAELVARAGEVDRLKTDLQAVQAESQNLRSEVAQLTQRAEETQKKLESEVVISVHASSRLGLWSGPTYPRRCPDDGMRRPRGSLSLRQSAECMPFVMFPIVADSRVKGRLLRRRLGPCHHVLHSVTVTRLD